MGSGCRTGCCWCAARRSSPKALPTVGTDRKTPVELSPGRWRETFVLKPAAGLEVDELPSEAAAEGPYGTYRLTAKRDGDALVIDRELTIRRVVVPVAEARAVKAFIERARTLDDATIVFVRK